MAQYSHSESLFPSTFWHSYLPRHQEYPQAVTSSDPEPSSETVSSSIQPRAQISAFLTLLPLEIRLQIYSEILSSHTIPLCLTNNGENLTLPPSRLALKLLSLPLTCHQIYNETISLLYTTNTYTLKTSTALRKLPLLPPSSLIHTHLKSLTFTFPLPHLPYFTSLPHTLPTSDIIDNPKSPLQPQDITWIENWEVLKNMQGLRKLRVELDVPVFWRNSWREKEGEMLEWIEGLELEVPELILGVFWDVREGGEEMRERFGKIEGEGGRERTGRKWKVERMERKGEEGNIWERDWGYLVDLEMSG